MCSNNMNANQIWIAKNFKARFNERHVNYVLLSIVEEGRKNGLKITRNDFLQWWKPRSTKYLTSKNRLRKEVHAKYGIY
ncbi:hypothetical protein [Nitrososphaeria virus YSH_174770]|uniref:Uncharacterized protein n=1 Tax=Nitrososphaeria virus YSH_174770 TaxID=3071322 RepID=A0A976UAK5_9CAUD|nr:hypothetical protein QKV93_gp08 [Yangshan Harbor Nitrososphaeria virus]UVF62353.1 hypothetical protein [Nitrososphaeria virus YSH_174770]